MIKLQFEAEEACSALETALDKNSRLRCQNLSTVSNLREELQSERDTSGSLQVLVRQAMSGVESVTQDLHDKLTTLESENVKLRLDKSHSEAALSNLHEQV